MDSRAALLRRIAERTRPRPATSRVEWCGRNLRLPVELSAAAGRYKIDGADSYWAGVLEAADDPDVEEIVIMAGVQIGKTTMLQALLLSTAALHPCPAMLACPDEDSMIELRDKCYAMAEASPAVRDLIPPERLWNRRWMTVGGMRCHLAYSRSTQRLSGKPCQLVLCTELDRWRRTLTHGDPEDLAAARTQRFHRSLLVKESTPSDDTSRIAKAYDRSDRRRFLVPCPRCGHYQELRFFINKRGPFAGAGGVVGLKSKKGGYCKPDEAFERAYYRCELGCKIIDADKPGMIAHGKWIPRGQTVDTSGKIHGEPEKGPRIWGGRLNSLYAESVLFGRMAAWYLEARNDPERLQSFWNERLGKPWSKRIGAPRWQDLGRRLKGTNPAGTVPPWAVFLTCGADVHKQFVRWIIRAWGEGGTSALVDFGTSHVREARRSSHLETFAADVLDRSWPLPAANPLGLKSMRVQLTGIDVGYAPHLIHEWWRALEPRIRDRVRMVAGTTMLKIGDRWRSNRLERSARDGKPYEGGMVRWEINRELFNADISGRWQQPLDQPGAWFLCDFQRIQQMELYLRELTNEVPVVERNRLGRQVTTWQVVDQSIGSHSWDAEAYAMGVADMITGGDWHDLVSRAKPANGARRSVDQEEFSAR